MYEIPSSVYRLQLGPELTFRKVMQLLPYLQELGVEGIYSSPIFECAGHSYAITNPNKLNPDLGTIEEWEALCALLKEKKMFFVLDVVPNHMGMKGNAWWMDVLKKGKSSPFASFFDVYWQQEKITLPLLEEPLETVLEKGLISHKGAWIHYRDHMLPIKDGFSPDARVEDLLSEQHYRLVFWKQAGEEINYRRFFNVNELIAIHIEDEKVLLEHHRLIFNLLHTGKVQGLRIDHPDGLYDPTTYFQRLRKEKPGFIIVEKILDSREMLPDDWEVDGTVGYDFLNVASGIFVQKKNEEKMEQIYQTFIGAELDYKELLYQKKKKYIENNMASEMHILGMRLHQLAQGKFPTKELAEALKEIMANFPVYRSYVRPGTVSNRDRKSITEAIEAAKIRALQVDIELFHFMRSLLLLERDDCDFVQRFQQMTAPVMAKGFEDSFFYTYNRLISLNEVGGNPRLFGTSVNEMHAFNQAKLAKSKLGFLSASTHDSKRSLDARMRLHVLSEIPDVWEQWVHAFAAKHQELDRNTQYYIYQMILALWPIEEERFWQIILKSIRESGMHTSWFSPKEEYEKGVRLFVKNLLEQKAFLPLYEKIEPLGALNSLSYTLLQIGSPGIVDLYQGTERLHFTAVDPDNRRPIDFASLELALGAKSEPKLTLVQKALRFRKEHKELLLEGEYEPLQIPGEKVVGFMRKNQEKAALFVARRFFTEALEEMSLPVPGETEDILTGQRFKDQASSSALFQKYPVALLSVI